MHLIVLSDNFFTCTRSLHLEWQHDEGRSRWCFWVRMLEIKSNCAQISGLCFLISLVSPNVVILGFVLFTINHIIGTTQYCDPMRLIASQLKRTEILLQYSWSWKPVLWISTATYASAIRFSGIRFPITVSDIIVNETPFPRGYQLRNLGTLQETTEASSDCHLRSTSITVVNEWNKLSIITDGTQAVRSIRVEVGCKWDDAG